MDPYLPLKQIQIQQMISTSKPSVVVRNTLNSLPIDKVQQYMQPLDELFSICEVREASEKRIFELCNLTHSKISRVSGTTTAGCYTIFSLLDRPNGIQPKSLSTASIHMILRIGGHEYDDNVILPYLQIAFHSPYIAANPFTDGFSLYSGNYYYFRLSKTMKRLLPPPYETNCIDYHKEWKARGGRGPMNTKECLRECQLNSSFIELGCVPRVIEILHRERICPVAVANDALYKNSAACRRNCKQSCWDVTYDAVQNVSPSEFRETRNRELMHSATVIIHFNGMETTNYIYNPKYESIETFSYVGGYVGMWLGISLVAVFDFLETLFAILKYPMRRFRKKSRNPMLQMTRVRPAKIQNI